MSADVDVVTAEADGAVSVPTSAIRTVGGRSTVTVRKNGTDTARTVVTGLAGDSTTVILSGLEAGAVVVLPATTPAASSSSANSRDSGPSGVSFGGGGPTVFVGPGGK
jgi:macrolide-specific efflux system membrane fusion protein